MSETYDIEKKAHQKVYDDKDVTAYTDDASIQIGERKLGW